MRRIAIIGSGNMGSWHASRWQALPVEVYDAARRGEYVAVAAQTAPATRQGTSWPSV